MVDLYLNEDQIKACLKMSSSRNAIEKKLKSNNSKDEFNILAVIDELFIGCFLSEIANVEYDKVIQGKTPDWYTDQTKTIVEVKGINQIRHDLDRNKLVNSLNSKIQKLDGSFYLSIEYIDYEYSSQNKHGGYAIENFEIEEFIKDFSEWFSTNNRIGQVFSNRDVKIEIVEKSNSDRLEVLSEFNIHLDIRKLKSTVDSALNAYKPLIENENYEFIIAIVIDIRNGLREIDLRRLLFGFSVENKISGTTDLTLGLFHEPEYSDYISGVIFMIRGQEIRFFKNKTNKRNGLSNMIEQYLADK